METLYLDTLICVNLFIDYILLCIIRLILHINAKLKNLLFASVFGSLTTLWVLIPIQSVFISALYKIATTIFIVLIAYGKCDFRKFTIRCLMFMAISMILSVIVTAINLLYKPTGVFIYTMRSLVVLLLIKAGQGQSLNSRWKSTWVLKSAFAFFDFQHIKKGLQKLVVLWYPSAHQSLSGWCF